MGDPEQRPRKRRTAIISLVAKLVESGKSAHGQEMMNSHTCRLVRNGELAKLACGLIGCLIGGSIGYAIDSVSR